MPVTKIKSRWSSGALIFHESSSLATIADVLTLDTTGVTIGSATNDIDFKIFLGASDQYVLFDCGAASATFAKTDVAINGDLTIDLEDIQLGDDNFLQFGDATGGDVYTSWVSASTAMIWLPAVDDTGVIQIGNGTKDIDVRIYLGTNTKYVDFNVGDTSLVVSAGVTLSSDDTTDASSTVTGSIHTDGGLGVDKKVFIGTDLNFPNASDIVVKANTAAALEFYDATTKFLVADSRNTVTAIDMITVTGIPSTITAASGIQRRIVRITSGTTTLTGSTGVTNMTGIGLYIDAPTLTDSSAVTVARASTMYIAGAPVAAGSVTITTSLSLEVAGGISVFGGQVLMTGGALSVGADAAAGTITLYPTTTASGVTTITMSDNSGATTTNINVAAQTGARTYTIPDTGDSASSFLLTDSTTQWWPMALGVCGEDTDGVFTNAGGICGGNPDTTTNSFNNSGGTVYVKVYDFGTTTWDDLSTSALLTHWTSNYQLQPDAASEEAGDAFAVGFSKKFCEFGFDDLATGGGTLATYTNDCGKWQYSTGAGTWSDLTVHDNTDLTAQDGKRPLQRVGAINFAPPADWVVATYDGQEAYWVQWVVTAAVLTQSAIIDDTNMDEPFVIVPNADAFDTPFKCSITRIRVTDMGATLHDQVVKFVIGNFTDGTFPTEVSWPASQKYDTYTLSSALACDPGDIIGVCITEDTGSTNNPAIMMELELSLED